MNKLQFEYFRGIEADQYSFFRIPKVMFTLECFRTLSCEAKVLYGLLLDRMSLSIRNQWVDEENRVYIIFAVDDIAEMMNCGTQKAVKLLKELDSQHGIGLIEKKRLGLGKPNVIYVKNFMVQPEEKDWCEENKTDGQEDKAARQEEKLPESRINTQNCENHNSGIVKTTIQECPESQFRNCENHNSGIVKTTIQECPKSQSNKTEYNKTEYNKTEYNKTKSNKTEINETEVSRADINPSNPINAGGYRTDPETMDRMEQMDFYRGIIRENISYGFCLSEPEYVRREVDELVELMVEVMASPDTATVRIAGQDKPAPVVKSRFMSLTYSHIEYVRLCLHRNTTKVENIKAYLLTALYNSSLTMNHYYQAEVNHDMYGDKAQGSGHGT